MIGWLRRRKEEKIARFEIMIQNEIKRRRNRALECNEVANRDDMPFTVRVIHAIELNRQLEKLVALNDNEWVLNILWGEKGPPDFPFDICGE